MSTPTSLAVVAAFLERCCSDLERGALLSLDAYLQVFPGHDEALTEVYRTLVADDDPSESSGDGRFEEGATLGDRFVLVGSTRRDGLSSMRAAADRVANDSAEVRFVRVDVGGYGPLATRMKSLIAAAQTPEAAAARAAGALLPFDGGEIPGAGVWIATPRSSGAPLAEPSAGADVFAALDLAIKIAEALAAAAACGVVHGDLRPGRVFVREDGGVDVVHFGLGSSSSDLLFGHVLTQTTPDALRYRSSARIDGGGPSAADDVRAAAVMLFEQATGRPPFEGPTEEALLRAIKKGAPRARSMRGDVPSGLDAVLRRALRPEGAYSDARTWLDALVALKEGGPSGARRPWLRRMLGR